MPGRSVGGGPEAGGDVGRSSGGGRSIAFALAAVLVVGALAGCGGEGDEAVDDSALLVPEEAESVVVRVSGTEGAAYSGNYGAYSDAFKPFGEELETVEAALGDEPTEYEVESGAIRGVTAFFQKTQSGGEKLKVEIVADDEIILESTT